MFTPIAIKAIGTDPDTQLPREIHVWKQTSDAKTESVTIVFDVVLVLANGKVGAILRTGEYRRWNDSQNKKFDALRADAAGVRITALIQADLDGVLSYETIDEDLQQALIAPTN